jgi:AraC family transcriptional regulator, regulatory protein of adaptative response / methylated-DNA-[protein]-cysteine methyltransferase
MFTSTSNPDRAQPKAADVLIPVIRTAATIGFAIAPCSLGSVIIAVSEHLIRSIMVGDDPEMLVSDLQNQFPNDALEVMENDRAGLVPKVVDLIEHPGRALELPIDADIRMHVLNALHQVPAGALSSEDRSYAK